MDSAHVAATAMELMAECQHLRDEIGRLRQVLIDNDIDPDPIVPKREAPARSNLPSVSQQRRGRSNFSARCSVDAMTSTQRVGRAPTVGTATRPLPSATGRPTTPPASRIGSESTKRLGSAFRLPTRRFTIIFRASRLSASTRCFATKPVQHHWATAAEPSSTIAPISCARWATDWSGSHT